MGNKSAKMALSEEEKIQCLQRKAKPGIKVPSEEDIGRLQAKAAVYRFYGQHRSEYPRHRQRHYRGSHNKLQERYTNRLLQQSDSKLPFPLPWTEHLKVLLCGASSVPALGDNESGSPLSLLAGHEASIVRRIYEFVLGGWKASVEPACPARLLEYNVQPGPASRKAAFSVCGKIKFPQPRDRKVNMMPFVMGDPASLPTTMQAYYDQVIAMCPVPASEYGKVCYLTVHESWVEAGHTQRRGGLHVEAPGSQNGLSSLVPGDGLLYWGCGEGDKFFGGLFMASSVADTTEIFDDLIDHQYGTVDKHGGIEHLRPYLGEGTLLDANVLVWFTDRTPHEALPQPRAGYRQFFRLVTSSLSIWYEEHSSPNPKVPVPKSVKVVKGSKF